MTDRELMQMALDALGNRNLADDDSVEGKAMRTLRAALAQPEPEPVEWMEECADFWEHYTYINEAAQEKYDEDAKMWIEKLRTAPPQRVWQGLTDEELLLLRTRGNWTHDIVWSYERAIEAKLKEKNGA